MPALASNRNTLAPGALSSREFQQENGGTPAWAGGRRASAAQCRLETRGRVALWRLGHEQGVCYRARLRCRGFFLFPNYSRGLWADGGRRLQLYYCLQPFSGRGRRLLGSAQAEPVSRFRRGFVTRGKFYCYRGAERMGCSKLSWGAKRKRT